MLLFVYAFAASAAVQPHGGMMRYPDVSSTHIVFVYADDIWVVRRSGGIASPLASPPGGVPAEKRFRDSVRMDTLSHSTETMTGTTISTR
jgi:tricorn protease-like protein